LSTRRAAATPAQMAGFSASSFKNKLEKLSESQQSIQTLSHWVQYHKKSVKESAAIWAKEVLRATPERRLLYIYLANDIMQNSRRKGNTFVEEFGAQLPIVMPDTFLACPDRTREKLLRLLSIWEERRVVPGNLITELRGSMNAAASRGGAVAGGVLAEEPGAHQPPEQEAEEEAEAEAEYCTAPQVAAALGVSVSNGSSCAGGARPRGSGTSPRVGGASPRSSGASPRAAAAGAAGAEQVTLAQLLTNLEEGRLVEGVAAEREAGVQLEEIEATEATDPEELERQTMQALGAVEMLHGHQVELGRELGQRQRLILLLAGSCERQQAQCASLTASLEETVALAARAEAAKEQVEARQAEMSSIAAMATEAL